MRCSCSLHCLKIDWINSSIVTAQGRKQLVSLAKKKKKASVVKIAKKYQYYLWKRLMGSLNHTTETRRREDERDLFQKFAWILNTKLTLEYINSLNLLMMGENKSHGNKYSFCLQSFLVKKWLLWVAYDPDRRIHFLLTIAQQQAEPWSHGGELLASPSRVRSNSLPPRFWLFHCTGLPRDSDVCCRASHWSHSRDWYARSLPCCDSSNAGKLSVFFCQVIFLAARVWRGGVSTKQNDITDD